jgi:LuxR family maltose regulon positive regulatory protein
MLDEIEKRQLLLIPLDEQHRWYRYHPLVAQYLNSRLRAERAAEIHTLHQRASLWYAAQEFWTEAVQHAVANDDREQALSWVKKCAMDLVKKGDLFTLLGWQRLFSSTLIEKPPEVQLAVAWGLALAMRFREALQLVDELQPEVQTRSRPERDLLSNECQAIRSVAIAVADDSEAALELAEDCLRQTNDPWRANVASNVARFGYLKAGDLPKFYAVPWIPYSLDEDKRNVLASVYHRCLQGMAEAQQLRFDAADRFYHQALSLAEQHVGSNSVAAALPASLLARIRYEQDRLEEAEELVIDRMPLICAGTMLECVLNAHFVMIKIARRAGNSERAYSLLEQAESLANARGWGRLSAGVLLERTRLHFEEGRMSEGIASLDRLKRLALEHPTSGPCAWSDIHRFTGLGDAYLAAAEERFEDAVFILKALLREAEPASGNYFALRVRTLLSIASMRTDGVAEAVNSFRSVLTSSKPAGIYNVILDEGAAVGALLDASYEREARTSTELVEYVGELIEGWRSRFKAGAKLSPRLSSVDTLSNRESDILKLVARGLSNKEIARNLSITPETVKSHVKNIFTKLGVEKRAQAAVRAQSLGLVVH